MRERAKPAKRRGTPKPAPRGAAEASRPGRGSPRAALPGDRRFNAWLLAIGLLAFLLRLIYLLEVRATPLYLGLGLDALFYHRWAQEIASGDLIGHGAFFMGPLYPYFLGLVYAITGPVPMHARLIQCAIGGATAVGVALLGREAGGARAGAVAGLLTAFYGPLILLDVDILFPVLQVALITFSLYLLLKAERTRRILHWTASGCLLGLAAVGNASVLIFAPVAALWAWKPARAGGRAALFYAAGAALAVLPVTARNLAVSHELVLITSNAGLNLYIGNSEESSGGYIKPVGLDTERDPEGRHPAEAALGRPLGPREVSGWWASRARAFVSAHPGRAAALWVKKLSLFWGDFEVPQIENYRFQRAFSPLLRLPFPTFGSVLALAVLGAAALASPLRRPGPLILFPLVQSLVIATFFVVGRYRIAAVPPLLALAGVGAISLSSALRRRSWRGAGIRFAVAAAVFAATLANPYHVRADSGFGQCHYRQGVELDRIGRLADAEREYRASLSRDPDYAPAHMNLGGLLARTGRADEAAREFAEAVRLAPDYARAHYNLGAHLEDAGRLEEAAASYRRALALDPDWALAHEGLGRVAFLEGNLDEAGKEFHAQASSRGGVGDPENAPRGDAAAYLALVDKRRPLLEAVGDAVRGGEALRHLLAADLVAAGGAADSAAALYDAASSSPGAEAVRGAAFYELGTVAYERHDLPAARRCFERAESFWDGQPELHFALGNVDVLSGDARSAVGEFQRELSRDPRHASSWLNLGACYENALHDLPRARAAYQRYVELGGEKAAEVSRHLAEIAASPP